MSYVQLTGAINPSWVGSERYEKSQAIITAYWGADKKYVSATSINAGRIGDAKLVWQRKIAPLSINPPSVASLVFALKAGAYKPYQYKADVSWVGSEKYASPSAVIVVTWANVSYLSAVGFDSLEIPDPIAIQQQILSPSGFDSSKFGKPSSLFEYQYSSPIWILDANWLGKSSYTPASFNVDGLWTLPSESKNVPLTGWLSSFVSNDAFIRSSLEIVKPIGFTQEALGTPSLRNSSMQIKAPGFFSQIFGTTSTYNLKQFILHISRDNHSSYGLVYLQGGVKEVTPKGLDSLAHGKTFVVNTKATQTAAPKGILSLEVSAPNVSPRIIYVNGIYKSNFGTPNIRIPVLMPGGFVGSSYGLQTVWFHTRPLSPNGIASYETGYPRVFDPTQFIQAPSLLTSAIFGDTSIRNKTSVINVPGIDAAAFSDYNTLTNSNRYYSPSGIDSLNIGSLSISNGTPELFPDSFSTYALGLPAIGYRIRSLYPSGFDRLALGRPVLTKTPELIVKGHVSSRLGDTTIWHKNRKIEVPAIDSAVYGKPTAWFRYRYVVPLSWQSDTFNKPELTHGLREVITKGFMRDAYGNAWISPSTRRIEPKSIYQDFASNHMVGGTQTIAPGGYIATLFGTRIVPESQAVYPLGFAGQVGLAEVGLYTRYLRPVGYLTVGTQPAERWGQTKAYNLTQYIFQTFDGKSGLVPPPWSDWLLIENRNKTLRASGLSSEKFGYSQIDNNAAPLLPMGIEPPPITVGLVSHGIRRIPIEGIEAPMLSSWAVVHNGARVISPTGLVHTKAGEPAVVNTRRYYNNIGRIDSLESGTPMISYRIRTIDIEPRYSIAPPQIDLPTIELYTRYATFQGIETLRYGTPSLSIHFNIISPKWDHREKFGYPALRNVTPELLIYGHDSSAFGRAGIRTQWREVKAQGDNTAVFGAVVIADTKRTIEVRGLLSAAVSQKHTVTKTGANPYVTQTIWLADIDDPEQGQGDGISSDDEFKNSRIPKPGLNQNVLYPSGFFNPKFGTAFIWTNNIIVDGGIAIDNVSTDLTVSNKNNFISLDGKGIENEVIVGEPRLSPHTIYAVKEAPAQAKANHPTNNLHYVGEQPGIPPGERFGNAKIESTIRSIRPRWIRASSSFGSHKLDLGLKIISPESFRLARFGIPSIPFTLQEIGLRSGFDATQWGRAEVGRPVYIGPQTIAPKGIITYSSGSHAADNYIRTVSAVGRDSLVMGQRKNGDSPFMWQGLRVGEHVPLIIGGDDMSLHGETVIGLRIRNLEVEGFNTFSSNYNLSSFEERMRVYNQDKKLPLAQNIEAKGFNKINFGVVGVKYGQQFIRPDGNSDQFRKGGYHA